MRNSHSKYQPSWFFVLKDNRCGVSLLNSNYQTIPVWNQKTILNTIIINEAEKYIRSLLFSHLMLCCIELESISTFQVLSTLRVFVMHVRIPLSLVWSTFTEAGVVSSGHATCCYLRSSVVCRGTRNFFLFLPFPLFLSLTGNCIYMVDSELIYQLIRFPF